MGSIFKSFEKIYSRSLSSLNSIVPGRNLLLPSRITIIPTNTCNLKCDFCAVKDDLNTIPENLLSRDEWKELISKIPRFSIIDFTGGEPFLSPHMNYIMNELGRKKRPMAIITNGTTMNSKNLDTILNSGVLLYMCSLDGLANTHDEIRKMKGAFHRAHQAFEYINKFKHDHKKLFPKTCIKTTLLEESFRELPELVKYAKLDARVNQLQIATMYEHKYLMQLAPFENYKELDFSLGNTYRYNPKLITEMQEVLKETFSIAKHVGLSIEIDPKLPTFEDNLEYLRDPSKFGVRNCTRQYNELHLHPNGDITSCISYKLGNIRDLNYDIKKVFSEPKNQEFFKYLSSKMPFMGECQGCCKENHQKIK